MIGEDRFNHHRCIIFATITAVHVSFLLSRADAQPSSPLAPSSYEMQKKNDPSKAIVFAVLLSAFFFVGFFSVFLRNCSEDAPRVTGRYHRGRADDDCSRRSGLDDAVVESFPVFGYSPVKDWKVGSSALECAICLGEFQEKEMLRLIPMCNHVFHIGCIDAWFYSHATCPVCRARLEPEQVKLGEGEAPVTESTGADNSEIDRARDHVVIEIDGDRTGGSAIKREKRPWSGIAGKFPRSNSTGHSVVQLGEAVAAEERGRRLKRTMSFAGRGDGWLNRVSVRL